MRADISPKSLNKVFSVNNKITGKDLKTFKISSIRKLISSLNKNLNVNAQPNERKYKKPFKSISWSDSETCYGKEPKFRSRLLRQNIIWYVQEYF